MPLNINEIRDSGLLELYVLGELNFQDRSEVLAALEVYPSLKQDLSEIEMAYKYVGMAGAIEVPPNVKKKILEDIRGNQVVEPKTSSPNSFNFSKVLSYSILAGLLLLSAAGISLYNQLKNTEKEFLLFKEECEEAETQLKVNLALHEQIKRPTNNIVLAEATPKFPNTRIYLHHDSTNKSNLLQLQNLPEINSNTQSFQLWSLKNDSDPIPLDVFTGTNNFLEVAFEDNSTAYAITIEPVGGSVTPNLDELIGVFTI